MEEKLFDELVASLEEAAAHSRGDLDLPAERIHFFGEPDPREIRARLGMTQDRFAEALGISVKTLRNWEQGRRDPSGPAMRLLRIAEKHPEILLEAAAS
ncbi:MAG TPA: NadS family protein [Longimicrobium sp.]|jgi:putative transcriptional regulator|uniref:NadS family protein n=1 Tax=Longimicrobium sp. TaxID=2029185 RepID=UPI002EDBA1D9